MRQKLRLATLFSVLALTVAAATPAAGLLTDMTRHWAAPLVGALEARGIISGDEYFRFNPDAPLTRSQLSKLMVTGLGYEADVRLLAGYPSRFGDVPKWHWANGYIQALAETGDVVGYPDGGFGPEDTVTRAQLAVIFTRAAGLADQARMMQFEQTDYTDDPAIPDWARGAVKVAEKAALMEGYADGSFRPLQPVTRAEGSVALSRLLGTKGREFSLTGTLVSFDLDSLTGVVRDYDGQEQSFTMAAGASYFRAGVTTFAGQIRPLDQVWIVLGADGTGTYLDARYDDLLGAGAQVNGRTVTLTLPNGGVHTASLQPGALIYFNGRPASVEQVNRASHAYLILDRITGDIRVLDAVNVTASGTLVGIDVAKHSIAYEKDSDVAVVLTTADVIYVLNGQRVSPDDLRYNDRLQIAQNADGQAEYVMAER